ncbi:uncharacterized protein LOC132601387 [Lycium barbarum]|uniref:uncharacterized protein LOC132601387 n=1 Tax=Lycium barbarum TaxID=112863 RepID=UPI00293F7124|nr:uncharacterized protein LOC132601387 [Lycium barbarum]
MNKRDKWKRLSLYAQAVFLTTMAEAEAQNEGSVIEARNRASVKVTCVVFTPVMPQVFVEAPKANHVVTFYKIAFRAVEMTHVNNPKRKAEVEIPLTPFVELKLGTLSFLVAYLTDEDSTTPMATALTGCVFCLETKDVDAAKAKAVSADACCCGRARKLKDPYGNVKMICSAVKNSK